MINIWTLRKDFRFEAAHHLPNHDGKCRRVHGHSWIGSVEVQSHVLQLTGPQTGMVVDYGRIKDIIQPLIDDVLDHHDLNVTTGLDDPTSEALARWLFEKWKPVLPGLKAVVIRETCTSECRYEVLATD